MSAESVSLILRQSDACCLSVPNKMGNLLSRFQCVPLYNPPGISSPSEISVCRCRAIPSSFFFLKKRQKNCQIMLDGAESQVLQKLYYINNWKKNSFFSCSLTLETRKHRFPARLGVQIQLFLHQLKDPHRLVFLGFKNSSIALLPNVPNCVHVDCRPGSLLFFRWQGQLLSPPKNLHQAMFSFKKILTLSITSNL